MYKWIELIYLQDSGFTINLQTVILLSLYKIKKDYKNFIKAIVLLTTV